MGMDVGQGQSFGFERRSELQRWLHNSMKALNTTE